MIFGSVCKCSTSTGRFIADAAVDNRLDPTGTKAIRRAWMRETDRRFRALKKLVREAVVTLDVLGLSGSASGKVMSGMFTRAYRPAEPAVAAQDAFSGARGIIRRLRVADAPVLPPRAFVFARPGEKVASFMEWLREASKEGILNVQAGTAVSTAANQSWQNVYIDSAYQKAIRDAGKKAGLTGTQIAGGFNQPIHADAVGLIYTRAYEQLSGVTDTMAQQMSRVLAQGLAEGRGTLAMARALDDRIEKIGRARAEAIAQTEAISAYAEATLNTYEEAGVDGVNVVAEFIATDDNVVCPECEELSGKEFSLDEARGMIPVHVNCRCSWIPVVRS
jgi:SPP1 gp7 family putative phage head morphogenesis protein